MTEFVDSPTEERNPRTVRLDEVATLDMVAMINDEDQLVADAVRAQLPRIAELVDRASERMDQGGTIHYIGAGTSGRLAMLDAAELLPTFSLEPGRVVAHMAGGLSAFQKAVENAEDDWLAGARAVEGVTSKDVVVGLASSGRTPYVAGALEKARAKGALTSLITSNPRSPLLGEVDIPIACDTGPEALTGSTRMKSGTAQKVVLHTFSTGLMVRQGRTWSNLMVEVQTTNEKLRNRTLRILGEATGADREACAAALSAADGHLPTALVTILGDHTVEDATLALSATNGSVRNALEFLAHPDDAALTRARGGSA